MKCDFCGKELSCNCEKRVSENGDSCCVNCINIHDFVKLKIFINMVGIVKRLFNSLKTDNKNKFYKQQIEELKIELEYRKVVYELNDLKIKQIKANNYLRKQSNESRNSDNHAKR